MNLHDVRNCGMRDMRTATTRRSSVRGRPIGLPDRAHADPMLVERLSVH